MLRIGPSGNSLSFYEAGHKRTVEAAAWLKSLGLSVYEYSFGKGVRITDETAEQIRSEFSRNNIELSVHAPYYINFANTDPEMIQKSIGYVVNSVTACHKMGGERTVFHPASCGKLERSQAVSLAKQNIVSMLNVVKQKCNFDFILCPETMGKLNQIGNVEETLEFCLLDDCLYPCFDFGHINAYTHGSLKTKADYKKIIDLSIDRIGLEKTKNMHIHFSHIRYGDKGEINHLTFSDTVFGPDYQPLAEIIDEYNLTPYIVCESDSVMAEDALTMKSMHKSTKIN